MNRVPSDALERLLDRLEESKRRSGAQDRARTEKVLAALDQQRFTDAVSLIRFHEALLFLRAYPQSSKILRRVEGILSSFADRVERLRLADADLSPFNDVEVSGIAGTAVEDTFSYEIARWLVKRHAAQVRIDWEWYEDWDRLAYTWPRFLPLLEEDALVEANVPFLTWLKAAKGRSGPDLSWLVQRFEQLPLSDQERAEIYSSLRLLVLWEPNYRATRTGMKLRVRKVFYHDQPLIRRSDVSLLKEFESAPLKLKKLSRARGEAILDLARETSTVRYRELYGFTHGDPARVLRAELGRGVEVFMMGLPPERRLPLRAYHAALLFKNGVPVCYAEGLTLFERMEIGFNLYYTFRDGESAWLYARVLKLFNQTLGVRAFSVDPYQIGFENEEGIESGAFWFYRKLGFRPALAKVAKLVAAEERKIAAEPSHRTPAQILRQISVGHLLFEIPPSPRSAWDNFQIRNIGLAVQRRMADGFGGDARKIRRASVAAVERALGVRAERWSEPERRAFEDLALVLALIPGLSRWTVAEKIAVARIAQAKGGPDESLYVQLLQQHRRLRDEVIKLGS
ncbi:MAG TPA: hypothetical protein VD966_07690 [Pyrinomonadaceae bacterium]|nr:hypothetical protein [Pyrinomonadaceae bacterium]